MLSQTAERHPEKGIAVFDSRGRPQGRRRYPEVLAAAEQLAARLVATGVRPRDRVLICLPTSWELVNAWLGTLLSGAWPVAVAPAPLGASEIHAERVAAIAEQIEGRLLLTNRDLCDRMATSSGSFPERSMTPANLESTRPQVSFEPVRPDPEEIAFLQLTSGSTGRPRAVMIPHRAAVHNNLTSDRAIGAPFSQPARAWADCMVSWLPLNHDMGLVGCLWLSISLGLDLALLNSPAFLARPILWLQQLAANGTTFTAAPNFAYQLCVERIRPDDLDGIDLSGWRAAMTGSEMIRPETVAAFSELVAPCGFRPEAIRACYGLAEGTLAVTLDRGGEGLRTLPVPDEAASAGKMSEVVSVGSPVDDTEIRIVAPDGSPLPPGRIGEVRVKGPGVFSGYYNDPEGTAEGLDSGWLCTGDLGFMDDGELYVSGRLKDVLIIRGTNVMPHELEWLAESVAGAGGSMRCGAFSVARGAEGEQAVVVVETTEKSEDTLAEMSREIRRRIGSALSLTLADVVFLRRGQIAKTTSGKVKRKELCRRYLAGQLKRLA